MNFKTLILLIILFTLPIPVFAADVDPGDECKQGIDYCKPDIYNVSYSCLSAKPPNPAFFCQPDPFGGVFGKIIPPDAIKGLLKGDPTGAGGISKFFNNLVSLIYVTAAIVLVFMLLWGAWDWLTSEGDKEKLESAKKKLINAIVGIILFAVAFALLRILGAFTGFTFFAV